MKRPPEHCDFFAFERFEISGELVEAPVEFLVEGASCRQYLRDFRKIKRSKSVHNIEFGQVSGFERTDDLDAGFL